MIKIQILIGSLDIFMFHKITMKRSKNNTCKKFSKVQILMINIMQAMGFENIVNTKNPIQNSIPFEEKEDFKKKYDCD